MRKRNNLFILLFAFILFNPENSHADMMDDFFTPPDRNGVVPIETFISKIYKTVPGIVDEIELERKNRRWMYEITVLANDGRKVEFKVDALTGNILSQKNKYRKPWE